MPGVRRRAESVDESSIAAMKGVRGVVRMPDAVAVVADSWWRAKRAADAIEGDMGRSRPWRAVECERSPTLFVRASTASTGSNGPCRGRCRGRARRAGRRIEAEYSVPFLAHATMEPQTCTAQVRPDGVEVWAPTQDPATALATAAIAAGVPNDKVTVHRMMLGGGFGRRGRSRNIVRQAV